MMFFLGQIDEPCTLEHPDGNPSVSRRRNGRARRCYGVAERGSSGFGSRFACSADDRAAGKAAAKPGLKFEQSSRRVGGGRGSKRAGQVTGISVNARAAPVALSG